MMESEESVERRIVEVFLRHPSDPEKNRLLTGCVVAHDRILTAGHAFDGWDGTIELRWPCAEKKSNPLPDEVRTDLPKTASKKWHGGKKLDATVLECTIPHLLSDWISMASGVPPTHTGWRSMGFPKIGEREQTCRATGFAGQTVSEAGAEDTIQLHSSEALKKAKDLQGISGAPVFVGDRLIGVIQSYMEGFQTTRLDAVPTAQLLDDEGFTKAIGVDPAARCEAEAHRDQVLLELSRILVDDSMSNVRELLKKRFRISAADSGSTSQLSEKIASELTRDIQKTCAALGKAHQEACSGKPPEPHAASQCDQMLRALLPLVYPIGNTLSPQTGPHCCQLIRTHISSALGFAIAVSALNLHPLENITVENDEEKDRYRIVSGQHLRNKMTPPEEGRVDPILNKVHALLVELAREPRLKLTGIAADQLADNSADLTVRVEKLAERLNRQLAIEFGFEERRFFFTYQAEKRERDAERVQQELARYLPELEVVQLDNDTTMIDLDQLVESAFVRMYESAKSVATHETDDRETV